MQINWIKKGVEIKDGLEEGVVEIIWTPGIPMEVLFGNVKSQSETDEGEREWLIKESQKAIDELDKDYYSRRALFYNLHKSSLPVNCINLFHFTIREDKLDLYVYARSINMKNLGYDLCTIDKIYKNVFDQVSAEDIGTITFRIQSLHYYKEK